MIQHFNSRIYKMVEKCGTRHLHTTGQVYHISENEWSREFVKEIKIVRLINQIEVHLNYICTVLHNNCNVWCFSCFELYQE